MTEKIPTLEFIAPGKSPGERTSIEILNVPLFTRTLKMCCAILPTKHTTECMITLLPTGMNFTANVFDATQSRRMHVVWFRHSYFSKYYVKSPYQVIINLGNLTEELEGLIRTAKADSGGTVTIVDVPQNIWNLVATTPTSTDRIPIMTKEFTKEFFKTPGFRSMSTQWIKAEQFRHRYPLMIVWPTKLLHDLVNNLDAMGQITLEYVGSEKKLKFHTPTAAGLLKSKEYQLQPNQVVSNPFSASANSSQVLILSTNARVLQNEIDEKMSTLPALAPLSVKQTIPVEGLQSAVKDHHLAGFVQLFLADDQPLAVRHLFESESSPYVFPSVTTSKEESFYDEPSHLCTLVMPIKAVAIGSINPKGEHPNTAATKLTLDETEEKIKAIQDLLIPKLNECADITTQEKMNDFVITALKGHGIQAPPTKKLRGRPRKMKEL